LLTLFCAAFPYFRELDRLVAAMLRSSVLLGIPDYGPPRFKTRSNEPFLTMATPLQRLVARRRGAAARCASHSASRPRARPCRILPTRFRSAVQRGCPTDSGRRDTLG